MRPLLVILLLVCTSVPARADDAAAKALFDQGKTLFAEGKYGDACAKLEASFKLAQLSSTRGLLGACYEKVGKLASAWAAYRDSAAIADRQGNAERAQAARDKATELEPRLAKLAITAAATPGLHVTIDGVEQPPAALGTELPIDGGPHTLAATAADHKPFKTTIDIQDGEHQKAAIPALADDPTARLAAEARTHELDQQIHRHHLIAYSAAGAGLAGLVVAGGLGLSARGLWNDAKAAGCTSDGVCPDAASAANARTAGSRANLASIAGGAGLLLIGVGAAFYLTTPHETAIVPTVTSTSAGVSLVGRF